MTITITQEKLVALLALAGCVLIVSNHPRPGAVCELVVVVIIILGWRT
jgi:hypothetical protein